jgi:hypothetical protein
LFSYLHLLYFNTACRAGFHTKAAADTSLFIYHCVTAFPDGNGISGADLSAGTTGNADIFIRKCTLSHPFFLLPNKKEPYF